VLRGGALVCYARVTFDGKFDRRRPQAEVQTPDAGQPGPRRTLNRGFDCGARGFGARPLGQHLRLTRNLAAILYLQAAEACGPKHPAGGAHHQATPRGQRAIDRTGDLGVFPLDLTLTVNIPPGETANSVAWIILASTIPSTTSRSASCTVP